MSAKQDRDLEMYPQHIFLHSQSESHHPCLTQSLTQFGQNIDVSSFHTSISKIT